METTKGAAEQDETDETDTPADAPSESLAAKQRWLQNYGREQWVPLITAARDLDLLGWAAVAVRASAAFLRFDDDGVGDAARPEARLVPFLNLVPARAHPDEVNCEVRLSGGASEPAADAAAGTDDELEGEGREGEEAEPYVEVVALRPIEAGEVLTRSPLPEFGSGNPGGNADVLMSHGHSGGSAGHVSPPPTEWRVRRRCTRNFTSPPHLPPPPHTSPLLSTADILNPNERVVISWNAHVVFSALEAAELLEDKRRQQQLALLGTTDDEDEEDAGGLVVRKEPQSPDSRARSLPPFKWRMLCAMRLEGANPEHALTLGGDQVWKGGGEGGVQGDSTTPISHPHPCLPPIPAARPPPRGGTSDHGGPLAVRVVGRGGRGGKSR